MVIEVASIFALFYGAHPTIANTKANQVDLDWSTKLGWFFVGLVNSVTQGWYIFSAIGLTKDIEVPEKPISYGFLSSASTL